MLPDSGRSLQTHLYNPTSTLFSRSVHSQDSRRFDYEAPLVAKNENMATGSEPAVKKEWMQDNTNKSKEIGLGFSLYDHCPYL